MRVHNTLPARRYQALADQIAALPSDPEQAALQSVNRAMIAIVIVIVPPSTCTCPR